MAVQVPSIAARKQESILPRTTRLALRIILARTRGRPLVAGSLPMAGVNLAC
jgi:hypothetical protein